MTNKVQFKRIQENGTGYYLLTCVASYEEPERATGTKGGWFLDEATIETGQPYFNGGLKAESGETLDRARFEAIFGPTQLRDADAQAEKEAGAEWTREYLDGKETK